MRLENEDFRSCLVNQLPKLNAFATSLSGNQDVAADLVQETIMRALESAHSFRGDAPLGPWLFVILRNVYYNKIRKQKRETPFEISEMNYTLASEPEQFLRSELIDVGEAVVKLSPKLREVMKLIVFEELSYIEASKVTGCTIGTIKSRLHRARKLVEEMITPEHSNVTYYSQNVN